MKIFNENFSVKTQAQIGLRDISSEVAEAIRESGLGEGMVLVFSPHTTTAVIINENEPRLVDDFTKGVKDLVDWQKSYGHDQIDNNAAAHLSGAFIGPSLSLPLSSGELELGTWQSIFLVELDGPRNRQVKVKLIGE